MQGRAKKMKTAAKYDQESDDAFREEELLQSAMRGISYYVSRAILDSAMNPTGFMKRLGKEIMPTIIEALGEDCSALSFGTQD